MENRRRTRFLAWYKANYPDDSTGRSKFMRDSGRYGQEPLTKGRVSQLFDDREAFGERAARGLAERFGLPSDYFEHDDPTLAMPASTPPPQRGSQASAKDPDSLDSALALASRTTTELASLLPDQALMRFSVQMAEHLASKGTSPLGQAFNRLIHKVDDDATPPWRQAGGTPQSIGSLTRFRETAYAMAEAHPDPALREVLTTFLLAVEAEAASLPRSGVEATQRGRQPHDN